MELEYLHRHLLTRNDVPFLVKSLKTPAGQEEGALKALHNSLADKRRSLQRKREIFDGLGPPDNGYGVREDWPDEPFY